MSQLQSGTLTIVSAFWGVARSQLAGSALSTHQLTSTLSEIDCWEVEVSFLAQSTIS